MRVCGDWRLNCLRLAALNEKGMEGRLRFGPQLRLLIDGVGLVRATGCAGPMQLSTRSAAFWVVPRSEPGVTCLEQARRCYPPFGM